MNPIGYARTSPGHDAAPLLAALGAAGCVTIFCDHQVRIRDEWPQLDHAIAAVPAGGTLLVCGLTHIGRTLDHLVEVLTDLEQRGIRLRSIYEQLDTAEHGDLLLNVTHAVIEARRFWRSEATKEGLAAAVAAGRKPGRQPGTLLTPEQEAMAQELQDAGNAVSDIADLLGVSRSRLYRVMPPRQTTFNGEDSTP